MRFKTITAKSDSAIIVVMTLVILTILSLIGFAMFDFFKAEKHLAAYIQHSSVAEKLAQAAAKEALVQFRHRMLNFKSLDAADPFENFILAPLTELSEKKLHSKTFRLPTAGCPFFTAELIKDLGGRLDYVEFAYEGFRPYNKSQAMPANFETSGFMPADPFERVGRVVIRSCVNYRSIKKVFTFKYDLKVANTLAPVLSKFTLFARNRSGEENQLEHHPLAPGQFMEIASHGFADPKAAPGRSPLILVHHPADIFARDGYSQTYGGIREMLPPGAAVPSAGADSYRPSPATRGWVYLADAAKNSFYRINISPGAANPLIWVDYPAGMDHLRFPEAFLMLESNLSATLSKLKSAKFPYGDSFRNAKPHPAANDFIISISHDGMYWKFKALAGSGILKNYEAIDKSIKPAASLLKLSGDVQAHKIDPASWHKPGRYLDRRSPTIVLGSVFRTYLKIGYVTQNCLHAAASPFFQDHMKSPEMHKYPYGACPGHFYPGTRILPYFMINDNGTLTDDGVMPSFFDDGWSGLGEVDDTLGQSGQARCPDPDFALIKYDVNDIFTCKDASGQPDPISLKTYKIFMTRAVTEPYNKSWDWITANSKPSGGVIEPGNQYSLKQKDVRILSSYPHQENDNQFFYTRDGKYGGCLRGAGLKISQYRASDGGEIEECADIFSDGIYKGSLAALELTDASYLNPLKNPGAPAPAGYDIRTKAGAIFNTIQEFAEHAMSFDTPSKGVIKYGGVYYIDSDTPCDLSAIGGRKITSLVFSQNAMLIFKNGVKVPAIYKSELARAAGATLTLISLKGDITIAGQHIEASLNAPGGRIKKSGVDYFQVFGNITMDTIDFDLNSKDSLFKTASAPSGLEELLGSAGGERSFVRMSVLYDPALDVCDATNYRSHYGYTMSKSLTYWSLTNE
ncbi:MAG: hypothetical protein BWY32_01363 [bacterium ADurb.Bin243]|nr:MAG: hypothetical protein BWY32_01363 [bacterium ADurb.Bin243]